MMEIQCDHIRLKHGLDCSSIKGSEIVYITCVLLKETEVFLPVCLLSHEVDGELERIGKYVKGETANSILNIVICSWNKS